MAYLEVTMMEEIEDDKIITMGTSNFKGDRRTKSNIEQNVKRNDNDICRMSKNVAGNL
jgi:hypothetical protein